MKRTTIYTRVGKIAFEFDWHEVVAILEARVNYHRH
jgi:hypothetical protein